MLWSRVREGRIEEAEREISKLISASTVFPAMHAPAAPVISEVRMWAEEDFRHAEGEWQDLLGRSAADPLFMSWNWQWSWWSHHAASLNSTLWLFAAYSAHGELVGLAPMHLHRATHRGPVSAVRLETIGSSWRQRQRQAAYSEYLDFIVDVGYEDVFFEALADAALRDHRWSDLVIANSKRGGSGARFVNQYLRDVCYVREADPLIAQLTALPETFAHYLKSLHPGVRRKMWNHRTRLADPQLTAIDADRIADMFDRLNDFHSQRWGSQLFVAGFRAFHVDFARRCAERGMLRMSSLDVAGSTVSVMYNVRIGDTEYNIQSGFNRDGLKGASPGYLHFGFCLEQACAEGVGAFDFLAGAGRSRDYKRDFLTRETPLITLQAIRARPLAWLYKEYDRRYAPAAGACLPGVHSLLDSTTEYMTTCISCT
jgi:hypothetical protein